ncbi:hypothetical protein ACFPRL_10465 [Pseudoclavibacter helvolus]
MRATLTLRRARLQAADAPITPPPTTTTSTSICLVSDMSGSRSGWPRGTGNIAGRYQPERRRVVGLRAGSHPSTRGFRVLTSAASP